MTQPFEPWGWWGGHAHLALVEAALADPAAEFPRGVLADWLADHGHDGELLRRPGAWWFTPDVWSGHRLYWAAARSDRDRAGREPPVLHAAPRAAPACEPCRGRPPWAVSAEPRNVHGLRPWDPADPDRHVWVCDRCVSDRLRGPAAAPPEGG